MKSVNVNYSPGGAPGFFHDIEGEFGGKTNGPVACTISINFMEIEYMLSGDWDQGTDTAVIPDIPFIPGSDSDPNRKSKQPPSSPLGTYEGPQGVPGTPGGAIFH